METTSYVDPITNATVFPQVDLKTHLGSLLKFDAPAEWLPAVLHEGMHHECFFSPVGNTLALLRMRAYRRAAWLRSRPFEDHWPLLEDVIRQETGIEVLRPLAEGLACFEEFDACPGRSNVISTPMLNLFHYFGGSVAGAPDTETLNQFIHRKLYDMRFGGELAARREAVLASRFAHGDGGYLCGYMTVKSIFNLAYTTSELALDSELFAAWLRSYFYNDYSLVAVLLDPTTFEVNSVNAIAMHFRSRVRQLLTLKIEAELRAFEADFGKLGPSSQKDGITIQHMNGAGLAIDPAMGEIGRHRLFELTRSFVRNEVEDGMEASLDNALQLEKRQLICLGSLDTHVRVNEHDRVIVEEANTSADWKPIFAAPALDGATTGQGPGSLEFYLIPAQNSRVVAVSRGREVVFADFSGPITNNKEKMRAITALVGSRSRDLASVREQEENLKSVVESDAVSVVLEHVRTNNPDHIYELYGRLAALSVSESRWKDVVAELRLGGLYQLFECNTDFLRGLAFLGAATSVENRLQYLRLGGAAQNVDVDDVIRVASHFEISKGVSVLNVTSDLCVCKL